MGHQGYEYVDLGRAGKSAVRRPVASGCFWWCAPCGRRCKQARRAEAAALAVPDVVAPPSALFYGAGLTWGQHTHLSIVEYWRWWVVHLWVEGFFEVFATTVIAFFFMRLSLIRPGVAAKAALLSATIFLSGGIIGTCHHLYFSGTPTVALAWGSVFSALEVVPLVLVAYRPWKTCGASQTTPWVRPVQMADLLLRRRGLLEHGGGRAVRFHDQSAHRPVLHAGTQHDAAARPRRPVRRLRNARHRPDAGLPAGADAGRVWKERLAEVRFWAMNGGLMAMCVVSLLPVGLMQTWASVDQGYWYARSAEFLQHAGDADPALDARSRRHRVCAGRTGDCRICVFDSPQTGRAS